MENISLLSYTDLPNIDKCCCIIPQITLIKDISGLIGKWCKYWRDVKVKEF